MAVTSRRDLFSSGLALTASSAVAQSAWARPAVASAGSVLSSSAQSSPTVSPREHLLFDVGWKFTFGHGLDPARDLNFGFGQGDFAKTGSFRFAKAGFDDSQWRVLNPA